MHEPAEEVVRDNVEGKNDSAVEHQRLLELLSQVIKVSRVDYIVYFIAPTVDPEHLVVAEPNELFVDPDVLRLGRLPIKVGGCEARRSDDIVDLVDDADGHEVLDHVRDVWRLHEQEHVSCGAAEASKYLEECCDHGPLNVVIFERLRVLYGECHHAERLKNLLDGLQMK